MPDIIAFSETKLYDSKEAPDLQGYNLEHVNSPSNCGGVCAYISEKIQYTLRTDLYLKSKDCEDLWLEIDSCKDQKSSSKFVNK